MDISKETVVMCCVILFIEYCISKVTIIRNKRNKTPDKKSNLDTPLN